LIAYLLVIALLVGLAAPAAQARGRRPDPKDDFPDYNRLELRKKQPDIPADQPVPAPAHILNPPINTLLNIPASQDEKPKPPPAAIPTQDGSEPTLPDDMMNTLVPGTTGQSPAPSTFPSK
jgi:hypothetical protein